MAILWRGRRRGPLLLIDADQSPQRQLKVAWVYRGNDITNGEPHTGKKSGFEATPIVLGKTMYLCSGYDRVIALDARTGKPVGGFGQGGQVDLSEGVADYSPGQYHMTSAPTVAGNLIVVGSAINDNNTESGRPLPGRLARPADGRIRARPLPHSEELRHTKMGLRRVPEIRHGTFRICPGDNLLRCEPP